MLSAYARSPGKINEARRAATTQARPTHGAVFLAGSPAAARRLSARRAANVRWLNGLDDRFCTECYNTINVPVRLPLCRPIRVGAWPAPTTNSRSRYLSQIISNKDHRTPS